MSANKIHVFNPSVNQLKRSSAKNCGQFLSVLRQPIPFQLCGGFTGEAQQECLRGHGDYLCRQAYPDDDKSYQECSRCAITASMGGRGPDWSRALGLKTSTHVPPPDPPMSMCAVTNPDKDNALVYTLIAVLAAAILGLMIYLGVSFQRHMENNTSE